jgi:Ca-activated chloride channel family protein
MTFEQPYWFLVVPILAVLQLMLYRRSVSVPIASTNVARGVAKRIPLFLIGPILWNVMMLTLTVLLAGPTNRKQVEERSEGIDIMLSIDTSGSMRARDFELNGEKPTRLEVIKSVIAEFIDARPNDQIGLVVFGTEAFTQAPLTLDHQVLDSMLQRVEIGIIGDATAIGDGVAVAVKRLQDLELPSKIIILLTDGSSNSGHMDPMAAAAAAKALGIKIYTIGVGSNGEVSMVIKGQVQRVRVDIDEETLKKIAEETGGAFFRATDTDALRDVYASIDRLEKRALQSPVRHRQTPVSRPFLIVVLVLMMGYCVWSQSRLRRIPC